ncbi:MAG: STAS-like domain-containing protein [candidate division KSB1 bacterium]|nr:STAS-like domain-containing protein [candidate division KSB1 bacterium]MDZ7303853.1 STAS-like domain-containing protein [candidate division KSB1 bacterium]MDZ7312754.1 STAS-like domain-containing protein [candidate division KSB1 bacterium]
MIKIAEVIGTICITEDDGRKLYDLIHPLLKQNQQVDLDVSGGVIFASPFLNAAIGNLLADIPAERLRQLLVFHNLEPTDHALLKRVIDNAKRIFADPQYRENIKRVILEEVG